jgi:hypothetical protein
LQGWEDCGFGGWLGEFGGGLVCCFFFFLFGFFDHLFQEQSYGALVLLCFVDFSAGCDGA